MAIARRERKGGNYGANTVRRPDPTDLRSSGSFRKIRSDQKTVDPRAKHSTSLDEVNDIGE